MAFDNSLLAHKLKKYREQFESTLDDLSGSTGIDQKRLEEFEDAKTTPTGDEILILADYYKCDYKFFISNEIVAPFEQTEELFRMHGDEFSKEDRWAIQEVLFLAENEHFLAQTTGIDHVRTFKFVKKGGNYKRHAEVAAKELRKELGYENSPVTLDIYSDFRKIGMHVFRRKLKNSNISGLYIKHPVAGKCILINYNEDVYRQRFTATHEAGHAILDDEKDYIVSFKKWDKEELVEIRANTFASHYLLPRSALQQIPESKIWDTQKAIKWANKLKVNTKTLSIALKNHQFIDSMTEQMIGSTKIPKEQKFDPELPNSLSPRSRERMEEVFKLGLSYHYVNKCFSAYRDGIISLARMAEMMLTDESKVKEIAEIFGENLDYGS